MLQLRSKFGSGCRRTAGRGREDPAASAMAQNFPPTLATAQSAGSLLGGSLDRSTLALPRIASQGTLEGKSL